MSVLLVKTTNELTALEATANEGDAYFNSVTKDIRVWDGTNWKGYVSDGTSIGSSSYSLLLDGTDDRVELNSNLSILNTAASFSISAWVKLDTDATLMAAIFQSGLSTSVSSGLGVSIYQGSTSFDFLIGLPSQNGYHGKRWSGSLKDGTWHHIACVMDSTGLTFYLDAAVPSQSNIGSALPSTTASIAGTDPHIGSRIDDQGVFKGRMDDFAIFDAALTSAEVLNIKNNALYPVSKLKHLYKFEDNFNDSFGSINGTAQSNAQTDNTTVRP